MIFTVQRIYIQNLFKIYILIWPVLIRWLSWLLPCNFNILKIARDGRTLQSKKCTKENKQLHNLRLVECKANWFLVPRCTLISLEIHLVDMNIFPTKTTNNSLLSLVIPFCFSLFTEELASPLYLYKLYRLKLWQLKEWRFYIGEW